MDYHHSIPSTNSIMGFYVVVYRNYILKQSKELTKQKKVNCTMLR